MKCKLSVLTAVWNQEKLVKKALDSIPDDPRIEHIVINDGSTDKTEQSVQEYIKGHPHKKIKYFSLSENKGVSTALNKGLDEAKGEYIVLLGSDDYFLPGMIKKALNEWLTGEDLIFYDIVDNNGHIRHLTPKTKYKYVGSTKFMRRDFIDKTRFPVERRRAEDTVFTRELLARDHTERYLNEVIKHYNYPRVGSLTWNARHGITDRIGNPIKEK